MTSLLPPIPIIVQAVRYLYRHDSSALVEGAAETKSVVLAQQIVASLTASQAFEFASRSSNRLIQLMAIETRPRSQPLLYEEESALVALLHSIAANEQTWSTFVALYNEHPSIYPALQPAVGRVLASAEEAVLGAYVDSIVLSVPCNMGDRKEVTTCLTIFRASADEERRHKLWVKVFQRWSAWNFNDVDGLFPGRTLSVLDYAIVGYLRECANEDECRKELKLIEEQLARLEGRWFPNITDLYNEYRRLMSRYRGICSRSRFPE